MDASYFWTMYKEFERVKNKYYDPTNQGDKITWKNPEQCVRLHFGFVSDNKDPKKLGRVRVHFPLWGDNCVCHWVPVAKRYASDKQGQWQIPNIGDKVLCGFINDNPTKPYVIGSFYHPKAKPSEIFKDNKKNNLKGFYTKFGSKIIMDDTDGEEKITISMKDDKMRMILDKNNGLKIVNELGDIKIKCRKLVIDAETGTIKSAKGLSITSKNGNIKFKANKNIEFKSAKEIVLKSSKIKMHGMTGVLAGGKQVALRQDQVMGIDKHDIEVPASKGTKTVNMVPHPFVGTLQQRLSTDVEANYRSVATKGSIARHVQPGHIPTAPGVRFTKPPMSQGEVTLDTIQSVKVNNKEIAVVGSRVKTCNDPIDQETCKIYSAGVAVTLPILMPGTDPLVMETQGGLVTSARSFIKFVKKLPEKVEKSIQDAKWAKAKIKKGEEAELKVSLTNQVYGSSVYFKIYEDGADTEKDKPIKKVVGHHIDGKASAKWIPVKPEIDAEEDELKYFFTAQSLNCGKTQSGTITVEKVKPEYENMKWWSIVPEEDEEGKKQSSNEKKTEEEITEEEYGNKVKLKADVKNASEGKKVKLSIYEKGYEEENDFVHQDYVEIKDGKIEYEWEARVTKSRLGQLEEDDEVKYFFVLEVYGVKSGKSEEMQVTFWMEENVYIDPDTVSINEKFVLRNSGSAEKYKKELTLSSDKIPGDDMITLKFDKLKPGLKYTLKHVSDSYEEGVSLFEEIHFKNLIKY